MEFLVNFINDFSNLPQKSINRFIKLVTVKEFKKKDSIAAIGDVPEDFFILKSGIVRSFYCDEKGKEYIRNLFTPIKATGALSALVLDKPSRLSYDCLTDCKVYVINFKKFKKLTKLDKNIAILYANVLETIFLVLESKIYDLSVLNATERYLKLKNQIPNIENLIPQYYIASFLNITPVQLSRIRKELYSK